MTSIAVFSAARTGEAGRYVNAGDELLTRRLVGWLEHAVPDGRIVRTLGGQLAPPLDHPAGSTFDPRDLRAATREIRAADLVLIGGGTLLQLDGADRIVPSGMVRYVTTVSLLCRALRTPYLLVGVGVELPARGRGRRRLVSVARHADRCLVREDEAGRELALASVASEVVGDVYLAPTSTASPGVAAPIGADPAYGVISPRYDATDADLEQIRTLAQRHPELRRWVVVAMHRSPGQDDLDAAARIGAVLPPGTWTTFDGTAQPGAVPALVGAAATAIAMRLHAAYIALDAATPVHLVGDHAKVRRLAAAIDEAESGTPGGGQAAWTASERRRLTTALRREVLGRTDGASTSQDRQAART